MWDLLLKNGRVVDPMNGRDGVMDVAVENGRIAEVGPGLAGRARVVEDLEGRLVVPGIVDTHMHLGSLYGSPYGARMAALSGVTTCLDMAGPLDEILREGHPRGAGLNVAVMDRFEPNERCGTNDPDEAQIEAFADECTAHGALGVKLVGGHWPLTPEACRRTIEICCRKKYSVAWHAGTTTEHSDLSGLRQAVEIIGEHPVHLAHINSYCRGQVKAPEVEAAEAVDLLKKHPNIWSEAYLSPYNGTHLSCDAEGNALDFVTKNCLDAFRLPRTAEGIRTALCRSIAHVLRDNGSVCEIVRGEEAVRYWESRRREAVVGCFPVNAAVSRLMLAQAKREDGSFVVDAISTDGGCIPRNVIVNMGLMLVKFGALALSDFVVKASLNPARHLRLFDRGHFGEGAAADITVLDFERETAVESYVGGVLNMKNGVLYGRGTTFVATERGRKHLESLGYRVILTDTALPEPERLAAF